MTAERRDWHAMPADEVARSLGVDVGRGLDAAVAAQRLAEHGENVLPAERPPSVPMMIAEQFHSLLIYVLIGAGVLSFVIGDVLEAVAILFIAVLNAALGFVQEYRAEKAVQALKNLASPTATVLRDGAPQRLASKDVVVGDVLTLEAGDVIAADARLVEASSLAVSEALLTGESQPVQKSEAAVESAADLAERSSMVFQGTQVNRGRGKTIVVATNGSTEMGRIASLVGRTEREKTPLQRELAAVGRYLVIAAGVLCAIVFGIGVVRGIETQEMLLVAASLAVAAIPEGLPAAATIVLALGVQRMARRQVIIRRLSSVETLGSVTTVFTDKTGTLTLNRMSVEEDWAPGEEADLLRIAALCNNAYLGGDGGGSSGDPTEVALLAFVHESGSFEQLQSNWHRESEIPFDAARARMTVVATSGVERWAFMKGAPEVVVTRCDWGADRGGTTSEEALSRSREMAGRGLRVLAFAHKRLGSETFDEESERDFDFVGLVGMGDPLREEAGEAIQRAQEAGIGIVMLTGDQPATAHSIASRLGLAGEPITGREVEALAPRELSQKMATSSVFARVTSDHKLRIVEAAQEQGKIVAMTGDGVNDAPALRSADIGIAMGKEGTDVAREAADMVLTDDNFASIVAAIEEGRAIHANVRRFIHFLLACNTAEILLVGVILVSLGEAALTPLQILFVNLLTDGLPALALGVEPAERNLMQRNPRPSGSSLVSPLSLVPVTGIGGLIALSSVAAFLTGHAWEGTQLANSMAFATLVGSQLAASFVFRSETQTYLRLRPNPWLIAAVIGSALTMLAIFYVPGLTGVFNTSALSPEQWLVTAGLSLVPLAAGEAIKATGVLQRLNLTPPETRGHTGIA